MTHPAPGAETAPKTGPNWYIIAAIIGVVLMLICGIVMYYSVSGSSAKAFAISTIEITGPESPELASRTVSGKFCEYGMCPDPKNESGAKIKGTIQVSTDETTQKRTATIIYSGEYEGIKINGHAVLSRSAKNEPDKRLVELAGIESVERLEQQFLAQGVAFEIKSLVPNPETQVAANNQLAGN